MQKARKADDLATECRKLPCESHDTCRLYVLKKAIVALMCCHPYALSSLSYVVPAWWCRASVRRCVSPTVNTVGVDSVYADNPLGSHPQAARNAFLFTSSLLQLRSRASSQASTLAAKQVARLKAGLRTVCHCQGTFRSFTFQSSRTLDKISTSLQALHDFAAVHLTLRPTVPMMPYANCWSYRANF